MTELSALAGSEGYAACDDDGGLYCPKRPSGKLSSQVQQDIEEDFERGTPVEAFAWAQI